MRATEAALSAPLTPLLLRQRVLLLGALSVVVGLSWAYLLWMAAPHGSGVGALLDCAAMPAALASGEGGPRLAAYLLWLAAMWAVMAVAMMLPTALPLVLLFARLRRGRDPGGGVAGPVAGLVAGYLAAWFAFAVLAAVVQLALERADLLAAATGQLRSAAAGGAVLVAVGVFQLTPLKAACLSRCRSPLMFLMTRWREGRRGPLVMGLDHGLFCLGCCWALMLVMFVAGVMNLLWMAALTALMTLEKVVRRGDLLARGAGVALACAGVLLLLR